MAASASSSYLLPRSNSAPLWDRSSISPLSVPRHHHRPVLLPANLNVGDDFAFFWDRCGVDAGLRIPIRPFLKKTMELVGRDKVKDGSHLFQNLLFQFGRNEMGLQIQAPSLQVLSSAFGIAFGFLDSCLRPTAAYFLVIIIWGEEDVTTSKTDIAVFCILWSFFTMAILGSLRNSVAITYSAVVGRSNDLLEDMIVHMQCNFVVDAMVGQWRMLFCACGHKLCFPLTLMVVLLTFSLHLFCFCNVVAAVKRAEKLKKKGQPPKKIRLPLKSPAKRKKQ
jgi:hypothetical protein